MNCIYLGRLLLSLIACFLILATPQVFGNQPITLNPDQRFIGSEPGKFKFNQQHYYWSAIALRSASPRNWDMALYTDDQYQDRVAFSDQEAGLVDIIAMNYNYAPTGTEGVKVFLLEGSWNYSIEYDTSIKHLDTNAENGPYFYWPTQLVEVWEVWLNGGDSFLFQLENMDELSDPGIALFDSNGTTNLYIERKEAAAVSDTHGAGEGESFIYTSSHDGWYGFVVWFNTNGFNEFKINIKENSFEVSPWYFKYLKLLQPNPYAPIKLH